MFFFFNIVELPTGFLILTVLEVRHTRLSSFFFFGKNGHGQPEDSDPGGLLLTFVMSADGRKFQLCLCVRTPILQKYTFKRLKDFFFNNKKKIDFFF